MAFWLHCCLCAYTEGETTAGALLTVSHYTTALNQSGVVGEYDGILKEEYRRGAQLNT